MLDSLTGFEWDVHNAGHIALHDVSPSEVEETVMSRHVIFPAARRGGELRWKLLGQTTAGRHLVVVFTVRENRFRTVTAYTMNEVERRTYATEIGS